METERKTVKHNGCHSRNASGGNPFDLDQSKMRLIVTTNPEWKDLFIEIGGTDEMLDPAFPLRYRLL